MSPRQSIRNHRKALEASASPRGPLPKSRRPKVIHNPAATPDDCEPCSVVARPRVKMSGLSYSMTVQVGDGPALSFQGTSQEELDRDLQAAAAELGTGAEVHRG